MTTVLEEADRWGRTGAVLATFDAPLGIPESYMTAAAGVPSWRSPTTFLEFLERAYATPHFFDSTSVSDDWKIEQPFFSVPTGEGGLRSYLEAAARQGVDLYRAIDKKTGAKTLFAKSGIPGTVGSATCALWQDLGPRLVTGRDFSVWPFDGDGDLNLLLKFTQVVIGEIYPRAAYATALLDASADTRPRLALAKTDANVRRGALARLQTAEWVRRLGVTIENLVEAEANEDDFDACMTATALLRCVLEKLPLCVSTLDSARVEGGILGTGSVNLALPERTFGKLPREGRAPGERRGHGPSAAVVRDGARTLRCPIVGCDKVYLNGRGGWDGHVGSVRIHPRWHPELTSAEDRKRQFEIEFRDFFK